MLQKLTPRAVLTRSIALFAVLAITTGWSGPAQAQTPPNLASAPAAVAIHDHAVTAARAIAWDLRHDARAVAADIARYGGATGPGDGGRSSLGVAAEARAGAFAKAAAAAEAKARAEAASKAKAAAKARAAAAASAAHAPSYRGTNHFWIPSLGMSYGVRPYGCGQTFYPGNHIYRWGCAGRNNVYLLGHAYSVMKPLHDLYVRGGLRVGMVAIYADAGGHVTKYRVTEWRVVRPTEIAWQIAAQRVPSMTLQTCIGADSQYRLNVRLVAVR